MIGRKTRRPCNATFMCRFATSRHIMEARSASVDTCAVSIWQVPRLPDFSRASFARVIASSDILYTTKENGGHGPKMRPPEGKFAVHRGGRDRTLSRQAAQHRIASDGERQRHAADAGKSVRFLFQKLKSISPIDSDNLIDF